MLVRPAAGVDLGPELRFIRLDDADRYARARPQWDLVERAIQHVADLDWLISAAHQKLRRERLHGWCRRRAPRRTAPSLQARWRWPLRTGRARRSVSPANLARHR